MKKIEKQAIQEMAKVIDEYTEPLSARDIHKAEFSEKFAKHLYTEGYRKQSEGEWVEIPNPWKMEDGSHTYVCSVCKEQISVLGNPLHYCGYCGAKMKGE